MQPENARSNNIELHVEEDKLAMPEFKALWSRINAKSVYVVDFDTNELIKKSIAVDEDKITAAEDSDASKETSAESIKEPEAPVIPEGSFESIEATKELTDKPSEETSIPEVSEPKKIVIELPGAYLDEAELGRVRAIVASKASVLKKALETDDLSIERNEDKICFPWFTDHGIDGEAKAYMQLVSGIAKRAKMLTRVTATESVSENDKFTMRLFLVSLNFKGTEYAFARKFLLRNLSGNSGWRTEEAKARHDARKVRAEIEAPEVTIGQSSEGGEADAGISE